MNKKPAIMLRHRHSPAFNVNEKGKDNSYVDRDRSFDW